MGTLLVPYSIGGLTLIWSVLHPHLLPLYMYIGDTQVHCLSPIVLKEACSAAGLKKKKKKFQFSGAMLKGTGRMLVILQKAQSHITCLA